MDHVSRQAAKIDEHRLRTERFIKEFSGLKLIVLPKVFPGGTDTALLCDSLVVHPGERVLDLCTGTGAVAIKAALAGAGEVVGTDISPDAVRNANENKANYVLENVTFIQANLFPEPPTHFDVITINPPYTDRPAPDVTAAMFWDKDNVVLKTLFKRLPEFLAPAGRLYLTWPSFASHDLPHRLAQEAGYAITSISQRTSRSSNFTYHVYLITLASAAEVV